MFSRRKLISYLSFFVLFLVTIIPTLSAEVCAQEFNALTKLDANSIARSKEKIELSIKYYKLKSEGHFEEAHRLLKSIYPMTKTSIFDIAFNRSANEIKLSPPEYSILARPAGKKLLIGYRAQEEPTYCCPASIQMMLTTRNRYEDQTKIAHALGTGENGTDLGWKIPEYLNSHMDVIGSYEISYGYNLTEYSIRSIVALDVDAGFPVLLNIAANAPSFCTDSMYPINTQHYVVIYGYNYVSGEKLNIADPAGGQVSLGFGTVPKLYEKTVGEVQQLVKAKGLVH